MRHIKPRLAALSAAILVSLTLAACGAAAEPTPTTEIIAEPTSTTLPAPTEAATLAPTLEPTTTPTPIEAATSEPTAEIVDPTSTPSSVDTLLAAFAAAPQAQGDVIYVTGRVLSENGDPIPGAIVEIWQTDTNGVYDHPGDASTASRDQTFQFYGASTADADGVYVFRTIEPGYYEPRPKHIHVKVKIDGAEVLTTQFYFEADRATLADEGVFSQAGDMGDLLILKETAAVDANGDPIRILTNDLVIDTESGTGTLTPTPAQAEGPYYPVVDVTQYDNDLTIVP